ncbi:MAG: MBL fold metallo-hydrolase, partial [Planctomycetota bacterium]
MIRHIVALLVLLLASACHAPVAPAEPATSSAPSPRSEPAARSRFEVLVLGIAQDGGLPHVGCNKECCERARREGWALHPACIAVHDRQDKRLLLIEATPHVEAQLALLHGLTANKNRGRRPADAVMISHAHIGHYLGLAHFGKEVAATKGLPVHVSPRMARFLRAHGPWKQLVEMGQIDVREFTPGQKFTPLPGLSVEALSV